MQNRDMAIKKIIQMPEEKVLKVLIFMAGMEAERTVKECDKKCSLSQQYG